jgi:hypothetical protein
MRMIFIEIIVFCLLSIMLTACSLSFQNISTHGMANDLVDQNLDAKADTDLSLPI